MEIIELLIGGNVTISYLDEQQLSKLEIPEALKFSDKGSIRQEAFHETIFYYQKKGVILVAFQVLDPNEHQLFIRFIRSYKLGAKLHFRQAYQDMGAVWDHLDSFGKKIELIMELGELNGDKELIQLYVIDEKFSLVVEHSINILDGTTTEFGLVSDHSVALLKGLKWYLPQ